MKTKLFAIATILAMLLTGFSALAEDRVMTVQGTGVVNVNADRAGISLGVRELAEDVRTCQGAVNARIDAVISALTDMGVERDAISTNGIGIYPNYDYSGDERITGYTAYNSIYIVLKDVDDVGAYIDAAFEAGANSLDYVDFSASDTAEAADKALVLAVESAKAKAQVLAAAAGVRLGEIVRISDSADTGYDVANTAFARSEEADMGKGTEVLASQQRVSATVTITFEIGD